MNFAVIGTSSITEAFLDAGRSCPGFSLTAVYSRTKERAGQFAQKHKAAYAFTDIDKLASSEDVDAVYIASPNALHFEHCMKMLDGGKHVLCEKPIASNKTELLQMLRTAQKNELLLLEAMRPMFSPALTVLWERLPEIGATRHVTLNFSKISEKYARFCAGESVSVFDLDSSGGALMDLGVYCVHLLLRLFGIPKKVQGSCVKLKNGIDGSGTILAHYDDLIAELIYSKISHSAMCSEIQGEKGSIKLGALNALRELHLYHPNDANGISIAPPMEENDMIYELRAFIQMAETGASAGEYHQISLDAMEIMDEVRKQCGVAFPADAWFNAKRPR